MAAALAKVIRGGRSGAFSRQLLPATSYLILQKCVLSHLRSSPATSAAGMGRLMHEGFPYLLHTHKKKRKIIQGKKKKKDPAQEATRSGVPAAAATIVVVVVAASFLLPRVIFSVDLTPRAMEEPYWPNPRILHLDPVEDRVTFLAQGMTLFLRGSARIHLVLPRRHILRGPAPTCVVFDLSLRTFVYSIRFVVSPHKSSAVRLCAMGWRNDS